MRTAFKEWFIVVDFLARGYQIIILRKGGIREGRGGFHVSENRFWLFPTLFHQQRDAVVPSAQLRYDEIQGRMPSADRLVLEYFAEVVDWQSLESLEKALRLKDQHIWKDEVIQQRFEWGRSQNVFALAVRVYRIPQPVTVPMARGYGGCKSWITLEQDVPTQDAQPVLDEASFQRKLAVFHESIGTGHLQEN